MKKLFFSLLLITSCAFGSDYNRDEWGVWGDSDNDCQNTRQEILARDSIKGELSWELPEKCKVLGGQWVDPYTKKVFIFPIGMDIDHVIPLSYAHKNGADTWDIEKKIKFANDPDNLLAVSASANRQKGDKGPLNWLPSNEAYLCEYSRKWQKVAAKYSLELSALDALKLKQIDEGCIKKSKKRVKK